ncbi:4Fe-4S binding protein [Bdellovibrionota bacterium FG-2]
MQTPTKPTIKPRGPVQEFFTGIGSLLKGMKITFGYFSHPSTVVTQQYPENRETLKMVERARIRLTMPHDENGYHKCTGCHICEDACPNRSITVVDRKNATSKRQEIDHFIWRMDSCTFCNLCVIVCPFTALKMNGEFENSVYDRRLLIYNLNRYAGPAAPALAKIVDPEERKRNIDERGVYSGHIPMNGSAIAGVPACGKPPESEKANSYD